MHAENDNNETKLDGPGRRLIERTALLPDSALDICVDDLPAPPVVARVPDLAELFETLLYQMRRVEAQVVSAGRELIQVSLVGPDVSPLSPSVDRALHLITASIDATRTALRVLEARQQQHRAQG